ncbi:MAG: hypothetical protein R3C30_03735 [Hyphomonadaceae bacterium]
MPGFIGEIEGVEHAVQISEDIGYPVMIKASASGGGKGIRVAYNRKEVEEGFPAVRAEAKAFGDDRIFIEKFVTARARIEIQGDGPISTATSCISSKRSARSNAAIESHRRGAVAAAR